MGKCRPCPYRNISPVTMLVWYNENPKPQPCHKNEAKSCAGAVEFGKVIEGLRATGNGPYPKFKRRTAEETKDD